MLLTLTVKEVVPETARASVVKVDLDGHLFEHAAGQAIKIGIHGGETRKPYSIASAPEDLERNGYFELLVPHGTFQDGARVDVEGPLGSFTFPARPEERRFVFIAGGTGIAPLRSMLRHALAIPHRDIGLFYSARTPDEFAFEAELRDLARGGQIELRQTVTRADATAAWSGSRGRLDGAALAELVHDPATLCFICGPASLVDDMPKQLRELGVPPSRIRIEEWGPPATST